MTTAGTDFEVDVIERSRNLPVLVDFWAPWCGPCKVLGPVLEKLEAEAAGAWKLVKIDTDQQEDLAAAHGIRGIPDVRLFHLGKEVGRFTGALPEIQVRQWLAANLPTPEREAMARARELLLEGQTTEALATLKPLASGVTGSPELIALTASAEVFSHPEGASARIQSLPTVNGVEDESAFVSEFARLFARPPTQDQSPLDQLYREGVEALRRGDYESGARSFIDLLLEKPGYDDGHVKATCLALFRFLGLRHPVTEKLSRSFGMAVNV